MEVIDTKQLSQSEKARLRIRRFHENNPGKHREYRLRWRQNHPEAWKAVNADWESRNVEKRKAYGKLAAATKAAKQEELAGCPRADVCELCLNPESKGRGGVKTVWDHDHRTGLFRGWLCDSCNKFLGGYRDNAAFLRRAADYVERGGMLRTVDQQMDWMESWGMGLAA